MNTSKKTSDSGRLPGDFSWRFFILRWLPFFAYSFFVVLGAVTPASQNPTFFSQFNDKLVHGTEFFLLFWFTVYALGREAKRRRVLFALIYCAAMGALTEFLQFFVPSRAMSLWDFLADAAGFSLSAICFIFFVQRGK